MEFNNWPFPISRFESRSLSAKLVVICVQWFWCRPLLCTLERIEMKKGIGLCRWGLCLRWMRLNSLLFFWSTLVVVHSTHTHTQPQHVQVYFILHPERSVLLTEICQSLLSWLWVRGCASWQLKFIAFVCRFDETTTKHPTEFVKSEKFAECIRLPARIVQISRNIIQ